jgi:hypothetical protein
MLGISPTFSDHLGWMGLNKPEKREPVEEARELVKKKAANRAASLKSQSKPVKVDQGSPSDQALPTKSTQPPVVEDVPSANAARTASSSLIASQPPIPAAARETEMTT